MEKNKISSVLFSIGIIEIIACFIAGLVFGQPDRAYGGDFNFSIALYWWIGGFVSGMLFIGFSEVINLLQQLINNNKDELPIMGISDPVNENKIDIRQEPFENYNITFNEMEYYLEGYKKDQGSLAFSEKSLSFFKENKMLFEIFYSKIRNCVILDKSNNNAIVNVFHENNFGKEIVIGLYNHANPMSIGNEIFERIQYYTRK